MVYAILFLIVRMLNLPEAALPAAPLSPASTVGGFMRLVSILMALILIAISCAVCWGQVADECKPSVLNIPEAKYPCIYPDNRAMFRVIAPDAQKASVRIGRGFDMTKGPDNIWTVTTTPLVEGFHYYSLQIDGATVADPSTMTFFGSGWQNSGIEIPAPDQEFYLPKDVPRGPGRWRRNEPLDFYRDDVHGFIIHD
jgi:hypothetical protein